MRAVYKSLAGQRFGRFLVTDQYEIKNKCTYWLCQCDCGNQKWVFYTSLKRSRSTSCGCLRKDNHPLLTHGQRQKGNTTPEYRAWCGLKNRCLNPNNRAYRHYGGRGIEVCDRWKNSFESFFTDMGLRPKGTSLDRIDNDGDYEPGNCRWEKANVQAINQRYRLVILVTKAEKAQLMADAGTSTLPDFVRGKILSPGCSLDR